MMNALSVSTVIPTYNRVNLIRRSVMSVLAASSPQDEIIVVDDGSTDNTVDVLSEFNDSIIYIRTANAGAGAARNRGIAEAKGDLIAFLDSDDEWMPHKLDLQRRFMASRPDILFTFSDFMATDENGGEHHSYLQHWHKDPRPWDEILGPAELLSSIADMPEKYCDIRYYVGNLYKSELSSNYVAVQTLVVRRAEAGSALYFAEDIPLYEDWLCMGNLACSGNSAFLECETSCQHGDAAGRLTDASSLAAAESRISVIERVWGADANFLGEYRDLYSMVLDEQRLIKAKELILLARNREAQEELRKMDRAPKMLKLLASFPDWAAQKIISLRPGSLSGE
ncbi:MAG: glycosyltransferase family 2 protein [candidate division Zixibacteria bacterium]|nr:glycosyltransferase family 2 protein [candidate division Zixibacteria bacterium]MBU1472129.1 glycosyltransferase family 2 protein [candidate division Zixibacteria bacterium]MBU2626826.1 glycosyltransferase family 2 protein [candidate division Zixibacteria bacterium]